MGEYAGGEMMRSILFALNCISNCMSISLTWTWTRNLPSCLGLGLGLGVGVGGLLQDAVHSFILLF